MVQLYTELVYSIGHISRIFSLSYVTLSTFAEERKDKEFDMKANSSTARSKIEYNEEVKALRVEIAHLKNNWIMPRLKQNCIMK